MIWDITPEILTSLLPMFSGEPMKCLFAKASGYIITIMKYIQHAIMGMILAFSILIFGWNFSTFLLNIAMLKLIMKISKHISPMAVLKLYGGVYVLLLISIDSNIGYMR